MASDDPLGGPAATGAPYTPAGEPLDRPAAPPARPEEPAEYAEPERGANESPGVMIPARSRRSAVESFFMRLIATGGIIGIGVAIAAIMASQHSHGWLIGLVVAVVSVILAAILWSSRRL